MLIGNGNGNVSLEIIFTVKQFACIYTRNQLFILYFIF